MHVTMSARANIPKYRQTDTRTYAPTSIGMRMPIAGATWTFFVPIWRKLLRNLCVFVTQVFSMRMHCSTDIGFACGPRIGAE